MTGTGIAPHHGVHHGGGHRFFRQGRRFHRGGMPFWWWGPEIIVVRDTRPYCVWREVGVVPGYVFGALANAIPTPLGDGTTWKQAPAAGKWWAEHSGPGLAVYYECDFLGAPIGVGAREEAMQTEKIVGVGAVTGFGRNRGPEGLGILGNPNLKEKVPAGTYEITGTQVALRATPNGSELGRFNNKYGQNNDKVVEPVDTVDATGEVGYNVAGHNWARVKVLSGELSGKEGFVATDFLGEIGFTKAHGGTGPAPSGPLPSKDLEQVSVEEPEKKTSYTVPLIVGGLALTGLIVGLAMMKKKKHRPAMAHEARRRRRRIRRRVRHPRGYG
jgi:hypothetical protein